MRTMCKSRWFMPLFALFLGGLMFAAQAIGGHPGAGLVSFAGTVVIVAIIAGFLVEVARGHNGNPFTWLGAVAGVAYLAAVIAMRLRG